MVEMTEVAELLKHATSRSLLILDEVVQRYSKKYFLHTIVWYIIKLN